MKSRLHLVLSLLLAVMAGELLVACESKNGSSSPASPAPGQPGQPPTPKNPDGTSDSGGGTGIEDKVFESYIVDPTTLPAYREHLASLLANIQAVDGREQTFGNVFLMKTWYIAPVDLDKVGKDALGIVFMKSDTQQLARQTLKEIWIDKRIFDRMAGKDQAELLLHEMVMNLYMLKFVKMSELCRAWELFTPKKDGDNGCGEYSAYLDQIMPAEKPAPLSEHDNESIRFATGWLLKNARQPIKEIDFIKMLQVKGFDKRLFNPDNYLTKEERAKQEKKLTRKELLSLLRGASLTDNMPEVCVSTVSQQTKPCLIDFVEKEKQFAGHPMPAVLLRVLVDGEAPIEIHFITPDDNNLSVNSDYDGGLTYTLTMAETLHAPELGRRTHFGFLIFREDNTLLGKGRLNLASVTVTPGIITANDKEGDMVCEARAPRVRKFTDEPLMIMRPDRATEKIARIFSAIPPIAICSKPQPVSP